MLPIILLLLSPLLMHSSHCYHACFYNGWIARTEQILCAFLSCNVLASAQRTGNKEVISEFLTSHVNEIFCFSRTFHKTLLQPQSIHLLTTGAWEFFFWINSHSGKPQLGAVRRWCSHTHGDNHEMHQDRQTQWCLCPSDPGLQSTYRSGHASCHNKCSWTCNVNTSPNHCISLLNHRSTC